jgi:hypothetical protein
MDRYSEFKTTIAIFGLTFGAFLAGLSIGSLFIFAL